MVEARGTVSVVIPVYNDGERLRLALDDLLRQELDGESYEIIVVDNGSTDDTGEIAQMYQDSHSAVVRALEEFRVQGSYAARNKGILESSCEVIAFTDADCRPRTTWLSNGLAAMRREDADLAAGRIDFTFRKGVPSVCEYVDAGRKMNQAAYVERARFGATANLFVRRKVFEQHGLFRSDLKSGGDYEFGRRATDAGLKLIYVDDAIVEHPARTKVSDLFRKTVRVAGGQEKLSALGRLEHGELGWRSLIPVRRLPAVPSHRLKGHRYLMGLLLLNALKYTNVTLRCFRRVERWLFERVSEGAGDKMEGQ